MHSGRWLMLRTVAAAIVVLASSRAWGQPERPNIVVILLDDVGREVLGCYGGQSYATPEIDRLAAGGARFEHAYVMPTCHPTRVALLTGQYPFRLGHPEWGTFPRDVEGRTLASILKQAGYATAAAGKWQMSVLGDDRDQPHRMGFDDYCLLGWHEGPWYYDPLLWQNGERRTDVGDRYGPDVITDYAINFMKQHRNEPFFLWYATPLCHAETNDLDEPAPVGPNGRYDSYAEMVPKMDRDVGRVVAAVAELGLRERTLIVLLADNGTARVNLVDFEQGEYVYETVVSKIDGREVPGGKATLTDWGCRVPLILNWPGTVAAGEVSQRLVDASDLTPSLAAVAGASLPTGVHLDGQATLLAGAHEAAAERRWAFSEHDGKSFVRTRRWKLYDDGRFIDAKEDPDELRPLARQDLSPAAARALDELEAALDGMSEARGALP